MNREEKAAVIEEVAAQLKEAETVIAVDYRGISVPQAAELRTRLGEAGATFRVVKNRLTIRAADQSGTEALKELLEGPTALTFVRGDTALAAKTLAQFQRTTNLLEIKGGTMNGEPLSADQVKEIARLPGREQLQAQFVGVLAAPITGLVRGLGALIQGVAIQLEQIREKGLVSGAAPAAEPSAAEEPPAEEAAAEAPPQGEAPAEEPPPSEEAPGDPVAEAETAEQETSEEKPSEAEAQEEG